MALDFTNATGNLFNRFGKHFGSIEDVETYQGTTLQGAVDGTYGEYNDDGELVDSIYSEMEQSQASSGVFKNSFLAFANSTLITMVDNDTPLPSQTTQDAMEEMIDQMVGQSETVEKNVTSVSNAADAGNVGDGVMVTTIVDGFGTTLENVFAENLRVDCTTDSQPGRGGTDPGSEGWVARGEEAVSSTDFNYPKGSGGNTPIATANAAVNASDNNLLTNSDFEDFTTNAPDDWAIIVGAAGTGVDDTTTAYKGSKALAYLGDGAELTKITQQLRNTASDIEGALEPNTKYAFELRTRVSAAAAAGVLRVSLRDGTGAASTVGTVLSIDLTSETTSYASHSVQFQTPAVLPAELHMVIELTTALTIGISAYIDNLAFVKMTQHQSGPYIAIFSGAIDWAVDDRFDITVSNDYAGKFQTFFQRAFNMVGLGLQLPSATSGAETIPDSLVS